jgi:hypothetical protein
MNPSRPSKLVLASALVSLILSISCGTPNYEAETDDDLDFKSGFSFDQSGRYGIQVLDIDFDPKQTYLYLRVIDRAEGEWRLDRMQKFESKNIDPGNVILYVGNDGREKKQLVGKFYNERNWRPEIEWTGTSLKRKDDHILLTFEPIASAADEDIFKLQFLDFPELSIQRANRPSFLANLWALVPASLLYAVLLVALVGAYLFFHVNYPRQAAALWSAVARIGRELANGKPAEPKSEDEIKMEGAYRRSRLDVKFKETIRLSKELHTIEAIQEWKKIERRKILKNDLLSIEDKEERLAAIDNAAERRKRELNENVEIYEEDDG